LQLLAFVNHPDEMETAYNELYGVAPVLDEDTPDAGWLWLKRFFQNAPIPLAGGNEVNSAFATPGMTDSYMALTSYSNYAAVLGDELTFEPCWGLQPVPGVQNQSYLAIINLAPHPNAAKLFIRFITSEEGRKSWEKYGVYFPDPSYEVPDGQKTMEEILEITWFIDEEFIYDNINQGLDLYLLNLPNQK
jgi:iron(III) transport system substrate-binding protein